MKRHYTLIRGKGKSREKIIKALFDLEMVEEIFFKPSAV